MQPGSACAAGTVYMQLAMVIVTVDQLQNAEKVRLINLISGGI